MDTYVHVLQGQLAPGYVVVTVDSDDVIVDGNCIFINISTWNACPAENELRNTLAKRLDGKRRGSVTQLSAIAACILCSRGYAINHLSMSGLTESDMKTVWGFIETVAVCSSDTLSKWILEAIAGRSQDGYHASIDTTDDNGNPEFRRKGDRKASFTLKPAGKVSSVSPNVAALEYGSGPRVMDLVIADSVMLQRLRFKDGSAPPRRIGATWSTAEHEDSDP